MMLESGMAVGRQFTLQTSSLNFEIPLFDLRSSLAKRAEKMDRLQIFAHDSSLTLKHVSGVFEPKNLTPQKPLV